MSAALAITALALSSCADSPTETEMPVATTLSVAPETVSLTSLGATESLSAAVRDQNGDALSSAAVTWASSAPSVTSVSASGLVTAVAVGSSTITATSGSASGTVAVSVAQVAAAMTISQAALTLAGPGDEATLTADVADAGGGEIAAAAMTWSTDDDGVATVDASGLVLGVSAGATTLTAHGTSGGQTVSETVAVTVEDTAPGSPAGGAVTPAPNVRIVLPAGAVRETVFISAEPATGLPALPAPIPGTAFDFRPDGTVFDQPVTLSFTYDPADVPAGVSESELRIHKLVSGDYALVDGGSVDVANHVVTGTINGFSAYAVLPRLAVVTAELPDGVDDLAYNANPLIAVGEGESTSWSLAEGSGALPSGLALDAEGRINGTPTASGTFDFTVEVTSGTRTAARTLSITVQPPLSITTTELPGGVQGQAYGPEALTATSDAGEWTLADGSAPLPTGLTLSAGGELTGSPGVAGTFDFTVEVTAGALSALRTLSITVRPTLAVTTPSLPDGVEDEIYATQTLAAAGGDGSVSWGLATGSGPLPTGLVLAANGQVTGTPTAAGTFDFTVEVTSGTQTAERALSITVVEALSVSTTLLPDGVQGAGYGTATLTATGGEGGDTWSLAAGSDPLPDGLSLATNGEITGTPTAAGTFDFTVEVTSGTQAAEQALSIRIEPSLVVTSTVLPGGIEDQDYGTETLVATGGDGSYAWTVATGSDLLPDGLVLAANGEITGLPTMPGTFDFTVEVASGAQVAEQALSVTVLGTLVVATVDLPDASLDVDYGTETLSASGGDGTFAWALAAGSDPLPDGLVLASNGDITGTPTVLGASTFTVEVTSGTQVAERALAISVDRLLLTPADLCSASPGSAVASFEDVALNDLVRDELGLVPADPLTCDVLSGLTDLPGSYHGIASIVGLQNAVGLEWIQLRQDPITDLSPLSGLTGLVYLSIGEINPPDITPLAGLVNLRTLFLDLNSVEDVSVLSGLVSLEILSLTRNDITDIAALESLESLQFVALNDNPNLQDVSALFDNPGFGPGDGVWLQDTMVSCADINLLRAKGVSVQSDPGCVPPPE